MADWDAETFEPEEPNKKAESMDKWEGEDDEDDVKDNWDDEDEEKEKKAALKKKALETKVSEKKKLSEKIKEKENQLRKQEELKKKELEEEELTPEEELSEKIRVKKLQEDADLELAKDAFVEIEDLKKVSNSLTALLSEKQKQEKQNKGKKKKKGVVAGGGLKAQMRDDLEYAEFDGGYAQDYEDFIFWPLFAFLQDFLCYACCCCAGLEDTLAGCLAISTGERQRYALVALHNARCPVRSAIEAASQGHLFGRAGILVGHCINSVVVAQGVKRCEHGELVGVIVDGEGQMVDQILLKDRVDLISFTASLWNHLHQGAIHTLLIIQHTAALELQAHGRKGRLVHVTDAASVSEAVQLAYRLRVGHDVRRVGIRFLFVAKSRKTGTAGASYDTIETAPGTLPSSSHRPVSGFSDHSFMVLRTLLLVKAPEADGGIGMDRLPSFTGRDPFRGSGFDCPGRLTHSGTVVEADGLQLLIVSQASGVGLRGKVVAGVYILEGSTHSFRSAWGSGTQIKGQRGKYTTGGEERLLLCVKTIKPLCCASATVPAEREEAIWTGSHCISDHTRRSQNSSPDHNNRPDPRLDLHGPCSLLWLHQQLDLMPTQVCGPSVALPLTSIFLLAAPFCPEAPREEEEDSSTALCPAWGVA
ncbi:Eukaryotic translation initiation factor 3 subunit J-A [Liparis tanakae]|uniref:Eukaryotic translation initiation factor 3 subunit J-A n=1 Tax=Liparis tanakae TaxID=230148 RepID=A0A4Z2J8K1_9TELE|nr:Eukaryotic translation initiation factor 3 subunit J-A [Liparis tanakae]